MILHNRFCFDWIYFYLIASTQMQSDYLEYTKCFVKQRYLILEEISSFGKSVCACLEAAVIREMYLTL